AQMRAAMRAGFTHFSIQGRVDESQQGPVRGLQVYTTADGNVTAGRVPQLGLSTPGVVARTFRVLTLPAAGSLRDATGAAITAVPYVLPSSFLVYQAPSGAADVSFTYEVAQGQIVDSG